MALKVEPKVTSYDPNKKFYSQLQIQSKNKYDIKYSPIRVNDSELNISVYKIFGLFLIQIGNVPNFRVEALMRHAFQKMLPTHQEDLNDGIDLDHLPVRIGVVSAKRALCSMDEGKLGNEDFISGLEKVFQKYILTGYAMQEEKVAAQSAAAPH